MSDQVCTHNDPDCWYCVKDKEGNWVIPPTAPPCPNPFCDKGMIRGTGVACVFCKPAASPSLVVPTSRRIIIIMSDGLIVMADDTTDKEFDAALDRLKQFIAVRDQHRYTSTNPELTDATRGGVPL